MNDGRGILISLVEPVGLLKAVFREFVHEAIVHNQCNDPALGALLNYNAAPYMQLLITEMFREPVVTINSSLPKSTMLLITTGLTSRIAEHIAHQVFKSTVDAIAIIVPDLTFHNADEYQIDLCGDVCDIMIRKFKVW